MRKDDNIRSAQVMLIALTPRQTFVSDSFSNAQRDLNQTINLKVRKRSPRPSPRLSSAWRSRIGVQNKSNSPFPSSEAEMAETAAAGDEEKPPRANLTLF